MCWLSGAAFLSCSGVVKMRKLTYDNPTTDFTRGKKNNRAENERNGGKGAFKWVLERREWTEEKKTRSRQAEPVRMTNAFCGEKGKVTHEWCLRGRNDETNDDSPSNVCMIEYDKWWHNVWGLSESEKGDDV